MNVAIIGSEAALLLRFRGALCSDAVRAGHSVWAIAANLSNDISSRLLALGVQSRECPMSNAGLNPLGDWRTLRSLKESLLEIKPDLVLAFTVKPVVYGLRVAASIGVPRRYALISGLGYSFSPGSAWLIRLLVRKLYRSALCKSQGVFFQNVDDEREFRNLALIPATCPSTVVPGSGVDLDEFADAGPPPHPPCFVMVARLLGEKGVREFHAASKLLKARHPLARFRLVGPPVVHPDAISLGELEVWKREGDVEVVGESADVRGELAACTAFVLPSYYREGIPRSILEALASGRAVVTTETPGCRETVLQGENGFLLPPRDPESLARAMERFILDPELAVRMGKRSRELAISKFDVRKVNEVMLREMCLLPRGG